MSAQVATVEVLTAEVRVLMVGSRQVTLSVFRQLDEMGHEFIRPFGRVNVPDKDLAGCLCVVGTDHKGILARSSVEAPALAYHATRLREAEDRAARYPPEVNERALEHVRQQYESAVERKPIWDAWYSLPLIVLAGLR